MSVMDELKEIGETTYFATLGIKSDHNFKHCFVLLILFIYDSSINFVQYLHNITRLIVYIVINFPIYIVM